MMKQLFASLVLFLPTVASAQGVQTDQIAVRVQIAGRAFAGQLSAEPASLPATQPATQTTDPKPSNPMPTDPATVEPITIAGGDAPFAVHLTGDESLDPAAMRDTRIRWDFGDPSGRFNTLDGYNAAHVYDAPGTYTITRTIERPAGKTVTQVRVEVKPNARRIVHVAATGDDQADGGTPDKPIRSWTRATDLMLTGNVELRFRRGDTFKLDRIIALRADNVRLTAYGDPALPRPLLTIDRPLSDWGIFDIFGKRFLVEDLAFDATYAGDDLGKANLPELFHPVATNLVVRRCEFRTLTTVINGNGRPNGVLIQDNALPLETGLRAYLAWMEGTNWTVLGNRAINSTREHILRCGGAERLNIQFNDFTNLDRREASTRPDPGDTAKACLNIQKGRVLYVAHNRLRGANGVGPLGKADGLSDKGARWVGAVIEHNRIDGFYEVNHGASAITLRDNAIRADASIAFPIGGFDTQYGRGVDDICIEHNAVANAGTMGNFLFVQPGATNLTVRGNLYVAPNLAPGSHLAAALYVNEADLRAFRSIGGNLWPLAQPNAWAQGGVHYVAAQWGDQAGYRDPAEWPQLPNVKDDRFDNLTDLNQTTAGDAGVRNPDRLPGVR